MIGTQRTLGMLAPAAIASGLQILGHILNFPSQILLIDSKSEQIFVLEAQSLLRGSA
jgi:hypothetical protein